MNLRTRRWPLALMMIFAAAPAFAQMSAEELRRERFETIDFLRRTEKIREDYLRSPGWRSSFGGWVSTSYAGADNDDRDKSAQDALDHTWDNDLRFFLNAQSGTGRTKVYTRLGTVYTLNSRASPAIAQRDWVQPSIEMIYLEKMFGPQSFGQTLTVGRQYVGVHGTLAFAMVADGLKYHLKTPRQSFDAFFVRQNPGDNNIDFLAQRPGRTKRWFTGLQYAADYVQGQSANAFFVLNNDANDARPDATGQRHQFDSRYLGATLYGRILSRLKYEMQVIMEFGQTYSDTNSKSPDAKVDIDASALTFGLQYFFTGTLGLLIHADYLYGSGDADAVGNVQSTDGGSGSLDGSGTGGKDNRFMAFGGKDLGIALAPTLTNLKVIKTGFSLKPMGWSENRFWNDFRIHTQYFTYSRDKASGAMSDPYVVRGAGSSAKIGSEIDVSFSWRLMSDVRYSLKLGKFSPGAAYVTKSPETIIRLKISVDL